LYITVAMSMTACSSQHTPACTTDSLGKVVSEDKLSLPPGVNPTDCGPVDDGLGGAYLSFVGTSGDVTRFLAASGLPAASPDHDGLQRDLARARGWSIADVPYHTSGLTGASGDIPNTARGFELTIDERDSTHSIVYYYSFLG
jgi:hypothetical protein